MTDQPICPICGGTGFVIIEQNGVEYGKPCTCKVGDIAYKRGEKANIPNRFRQSSFKNFDFSKDVAGLKETVGKCQLFAESYPDNERGLLLQGNSGTGKTKMLCSIANMVLDKMPYTDVYYVDWGELVDEFGSGERFEDRDFPHIRRITDRMVECELLLFDELGIILPSKWVMEKIYTIINRRYNRSRMTCFATNYRDEVNDNRMSLKDRIGDRLRSRIYEMCEVCVIKAHDYRRVK